MISKTDIEKLFATQLEKISDESLRQRVVDTFTEGCKRGGWASIEQLEKMPFTLLTETCGINFIEHTIAVTEGAYALYMAQKETYRAMPYPIDSDRLVAGGILHDVGKLMEIEPDGQGGFRKSYAGKCARHPISGAVLGGQMGLPDELINIIGCHAKEGESRPQVPETVLIHLADFATFDPLVMKQKGTLII